MWQTQVTSTDDLEYMVKLFKIPKFKGVFSHSDPQLVKQIKKPGCLIINLDTASVGGTHWVCTITNNSSFFYLDSFGFEPPEVVKRAGVSMKKKSFFNQNSIQDLKSERCGFYCILFCKAFTNVTDKDLADTIDRYISNWSFTDLKSNDKLLRDLLLKFESGAGILDKVIDALPVELHMPQKNADGKIVKSSFIGPGTQLFHGKKRLNPDGSIKEFSKPVSKLDELAYHHDLAYHYKGADKLEHRRKADRALAVGAESVIKDPKEPVFNKSTAALVKLVMDKLQST